MNEREEDTYQSCRKKSTLPVLKSMSPEKSMKVPLDNTPNLCRFKKGEMNE